MTKNQDYCAAPQYQKSNLNIASFIGTTFKRLNSGCFHLFVCFLFLGVHLSKDKSFTVLSEIIPLSCCMINKYRKHP